MARDEDLQLAHALLAAGVLDRDKAAACLKAIDQNEMLGTSKSLRDVVVELGFASAEQVDAHVQAAQKEPTPPPAAGSAPPPVPAAPGALPSELGGFRLIRTIGTGSLGTVWEAEQISLGTRVALKILKPELAAQTALAADFLREARAAASLVNPHIVQAIAAGEEDGFLYFAMELVDGRDLRRIVTAHGPLPEDKALKIAFKVAEGLAAAARRGFVHRDIKPANIIVTSVGVVKIADLGLAAPPTEAAPGGGTPDFMAPEQVAGSANVDTRADVFALGATLFYMLTGKPPQTGASIRDVLRARVSEDAPNVRTLRPEIGAQTAGLVAKLLARDPAARPQHPQEIGPMIKAILAGPRGPAPAAPSARAAARPARPSGRPGRAAGSSLAPSASPLRPPARMHRTSRPPAAPARPLASRRASRIPPPARRAPLNPPRAGDDVEEQDLPVRSGSSRNRFTLIGLCFGLAIAALFVALKFRSVKAEPPVEVRRQMDAAAGHKRQQEEMRDAFVKEWEDRNAEAQRRFAQYSQRKDRATGDEPPDIVLGLWLKGEFATTTTAAAIAAELDRLEQAAKTEVRGDVEEALVRAQQLMNDRKPYEANELLANLNVSDPRVDAAIAAASRMCDTLAREAEIKARQLAQEGKTNEAAQLLEDACARVDYENRKKLQELQRELTS